MYTKSFTRCGFAHKHIDAARIAAYTHLPSVEGIAKKLREHPFHVANSMRRNKQLNGRHTYNGKVAL